METGRPVFQLSRRNDFLVAIGAGLAHLPAAHLIFLSAPGLRSVPMIVLLVIAGIATVAGAGAANLSPARRLPFELAGIVAAKSGVRAGVLSAVLGAGMLVLGGKFHGTAAQLVLWLPCLLSILPGALAGMLGAALAVQTWPASQSVAEDSSVVESRDSIELAVLIWAGTVVGFLSPMVNLAPSRPTSTKAISPGSEPTVPSPVHDPAGAPVVLEPQFDFAPDPRLKDAPADAWRLSVSKPLSGLETSPVSPLVLSRTGRYLAGILEDSDGQTVRILDLFSTLIEAEHAFDGRVNQITFSPDEKSLLGALEGQAQPFRLSTPGSVLKVLPIVEPPVFPSMGLGWIREKEVDLFRLSSSNLHSHPYDLHSLLTEQPNQSLTLQLASLASGTNWKAGVCGMIVAASLPVPNGTVSPWPLNLGTRFSLSDPRGNRRVFPEIDIEIGDRLLHSPDGSVLVRARGDSIHAYYFDYSEPAALRFKAQIPHAPHQLPEDSALKTGEGTRLLSVLVCAPLVNPITGKTVGPDRERIRAVARIVSWQDTHAEFEISDRYAEVGSEDVVADPYVWEPNQARLIDLGVAHRWWSPVGELSDSSQGAATPPPPSPSVFARLVSTPSAVVVEPPEFRSEAEAPVTEPPVPNRVSQAADIARFIKAHHEKATSGDIAGFVNDYHESVDFFDKGSVTKEFILAEETAYHSRLKVTETVSGNLRVVPRGDQTYLVSYELISNLENLADRSTTERRTPVNLVLIKTPAGLRIVSHNAKK